MRADAAQGKVQQVPCWRGVAGDSISAPEQAALEVEPAAGVVNPVPQLWQVGKATDALPPVDQVPAAQVEQLAPPVPGGQEVVVVDTGKRTGGGMVCIRS